VESLGARLKREREKRKITLEEISLSTKIGTRFLVAIEEEHFDQLPGGIFNKGFVKAYARSVGVDEAEAVAEYELATGATLPEVVPEGGTVAELPVASTPAFPNEDPGNGASRIPWGWFAIALLIVAFCFALWGFHSRERSSRPSLPLLPAATGDNSAAAPAIAQTIATQTTAGQVGALPAAPAQEAGSASSKPTDTTAEAGKLPASVPSPSGSTSNPWAFLVQIRAREDSWVAISADGRQIMDATLAASAEKSIGARDQVVIKTGNAGALDISFNGRKLPAQGAPNEVKTLTFDPNGPKL
jgi:cytoskeleton protein RodZ